MKTKTLSLPNVFSGTNVTLAYEELSTGTLRLQQYDCNDFRVEVWAPMAGAWSVIEGFEKLGAARERLESARTKFQGRAVA